MSDPNPNTSDLIITSIDVPPFVLSGQAFTVTVNVESTQTDFDDGVAFRLFCFVCACQPDPSIQGLPQLVSGHVNAPEWDDLADDFDFTVTAGTLSGNVYTVKAILLEGVKGVDSDSPPFVLSSTDILVI